MTYKEAYMNCETLKELEEMVADDIKTAMWLNLDRIKVIKEVAEEIANLKFNKINLTEVEFEPSLSGSYTGVGEIKKYVTKED